MADSLDLLSSTGLDSSQPVAGLDLLPPPPGAFKQGFGAGAAGVKANLAGAGALAMRGLGAIAPQPIADLAARGEKAALQYGAEQEAAAEPDQRRVEDVDWKSPSALADHFKYLLGNALPSLATMFIGGAAGRGLGALAGRANLGTLVGAVAPDVALEAGGIYPEALKTGVENPALRAAAGGAAAASLDFLPLLAAEKYLKAAGKGGFGAMAKKAAIGVPVGAALEGTQELGQSIIERAAAGQDLGSPEAISDYINSFAGGAAPGAVFGAGIGAGAVHAANARARKQAEDEAKARAASQPQPVAAPAAETPPPAVVPPAAPAPVLSPEDAATLEHANMVTAHDAAAEAATTVKAQLDEAKAVQDKATTRLAELKAEEAKPLGERRPKAEIVVERKALQAAVKASKAGLEELGGTLKAHRATMAELAPKIAAHEKLAEVYQQQAAKRSALANTRTGLNPAIREKEAVPASDVIETAPRTPQDQIDTAVRGVHAIFREQGMPLTTTAESLATPPQSRREVALAKSAEEREPRSRVKGANQAQMQAIEPHAMAVIEPMAKQLAEAKTKTPEGRAKVATNLAAVMREVVAEASKRGSVAEAQAHITAELPARLKGHGVQADADDIAKAVSAAVGQASTVYSKGAIHPFPNSVIKHRVFHGTNKGFSAPAIGVEKRGPVADAQGLYFSKSAEHAGAYARGEGANVRPAYIDLRNPKIMNAMEISYISPRERAELEKAGYDGARTANDTEIVVFKPEQVQSVFEPSPPLSQEGYETLPPAGQTRVVDEYNRIMAAKGQALTAHLTQLIGVDHGLTVTTFQAKPGSPIGSYTRVDPLKSVITLALNAKNGLSVADHEGYHYAEDKLLTGEERAVVRNALRPGSPLFEKLLGKVRQYDLENQTKLADEVAGSPQEAAAYAFEFWRRGELQAEGRLAQAWEKLKAFFRSIERFVTGQGFTTMEDIFTALDRGQFAERQFRVGEDYMRTFAARGADQTQTAAFKKWFAGSKVVYESGKPLVVYHGANEELEGGAFYGRELAGWFAERPKTTEAYMQRGDDEDAPHILPVYLSIKKPVDLVALGIDDETHIQARDFTERTGVDFELTGWPSTLDGAAWEMANDAGFAKAATAAGYDGIRMRERGDITWGVFKPEQIKSAIGNVGTFDPKNPDIRYSDDGTNKWYRSALTDQVSALPMKSGSAQAWQEQIKGLVAKGAVKQAEIDAVGLDEFLKVKGAPQALVEPGFLVVEEWQQADGTWKEVDTVGEFARTAAELEQHLTVRNNTKARLDAREYGNLDGRLKIRPEPVLHFGKFAPAPKITKQEVTSYLAEHGVQVEEVVLGEASGNPNWTEAMSIELDTLDEANQRGGGLDDEQAARRQELIDLELDATPDGAMRPQFEGQGTKYADYQLPGGSQYREVLLTLPTGEKPFSLPAGWKVDAIPPQDFIPTGWRIEQNPAHTYDRPMAPAWRIVNAEGVQHSLGDSPRLAVAAGGFDPGFEYQVLDDEGGQRGIGATAAEAIRDAGTAVDPVRNLQVLDGVAARRPLTGEERVQREALRVEVQLLQRKSGTKFTAPHFAEHGKNLLAHVRLNSRTDATGAKVLFLEELQSDWGQAGQKQGFAGRNPLRVKELEFHIIQLEQASEANKSLAKKFDGDRYYWVGKREQATIQAQRDDFNKEIGKAAAKYDDALTKQHDINEQLTELRQELRETKTGIVPAPFVTKTDAWVALVLKRMIRYAIETGHDKIAWTTGEQQVSRYTNALRNHVDTIEWTKTDKGVQLVGYKGAGSAKATAQWQETRNRIAEIDAEIDTQADLDAGAGGVRSVAMESLMRERRQFERQLAQYETRTKVVDTTQAESELSDAIGKAMADKIRNDPAQSGTIAGENITIDKGWPTKFYERIVPSVANDVLRKLDKSVKVENISLSFHPELGDKPTYHGPAFTAAQALYAAANEAESWLVKEQLRDIHNGMLDGLGYAEAMEKFGSVAAASMLGGDLITPDKTVLQPGFRLTPAIVQKALDGLPLFSRAAIAPGATVNIGLKIGTSGSLEPQDALAALTRMGVEVYTHQVRESNTEPTLVAELDRALTAPEAHRLAILLQQQAIAQVAGGVGELHGPQADAWRPFNPAYFLPYEHTSYSRGAVNTWTVVDGAAGGMSREAAERIIKLRTQGNSVVKPLPNWQGREFRVVEDSTNPGAFLIERRDDATQFSRGAANVQLPAYGRSIPGSVSTPAVHFSPTAGLTRLDSNRYGTGLKGAERARGAGPRVHFYVPQGYGVQNETGTGEHAYGVTLANLYDAEADPQRLWAQGKEQAVMDAGYDGYLARGSSTAVLLGRHSVPVTPLGIGAAAANAQLGTLTVPPLVLDERKLLAQDLIADRRLPGGALRPAQWKETIAAAAPDLAARLPASIYEGTAPVYRDQLIAAFYKQAPVDFTNDGIGRIYNALPTAQQVQYSRAAATALDDQSRQMAGGELQQAQLFQTTAKMMDDAMERGSDQLGKIALGALNTEVSGGISRWWQQNIATPNFISRISQGYRNVFQVLNTYVRYRNDLVERMLIQKIPLWYKASTVDQDAAFAALNKRNLEGYKRDSQELRDLMAGLTEQQRAMFVSASQMFEGFLRAEYEADKAFYQRVYVTPGLYEQWQSDRTQQVEDLIDKGYMPLRRYGDHTVHVYLDTVAEDGRPTKLSGALQFFGTARAAYAAAKIYEEEIARSGAQLKVEIGTHYKAARDTTISAQQFLDTARRNGVPLTAAEQERLVKALTAADSLTRNRMLQREGMPGYSKDGMRVLNEFGMRMAGKLAYSKFASAIDAASDGRKVTTDVVHGIPQIQIDERGEEESVQDYKARNLWKLEGPMSGFHHGLADELTDYVLVPDHTGGWSRKLRGAAMMYFIGGSLSGALVNTMSVPMMVVPELSIHTDYTTAMASALSAWKTTWQYQHILRNIERLKSTAAEDAIPGIDAGLRGALVEAAQYTMDTELHQIMGISQGQLFSQNQGVQRAMKAWMAPFQIAEQTNRITSFIAAYKIASTTGVKQADGSVKRLAGPELFRFARDMIDSTQNNYNETNRPGAARNPILALLFMFKSFPLFMTEAIALMYKANPKSAVYMLLGLTAMTGVQGLPFAEAIEDLIDTLAQHIFNSPFNSRRAMRNMIKSASDALVGYDLSDVVLRGAINGVLGISASSRIGAGDFVPGSRLGTADADQGKILENMLGAPYAMVKDSLANVGKLAGGMATLDWKQSMDALRAGGPVAVRNAIKGAEQMSNGYASDSKGRKLIDVTGLDAILQLGGLSSAGLAKAYELEKINHQTKAFYTQVSADLQHQLVLAMRAGDTAKVQEINDLRTAWNKSNPGLPLMANPSAVRRDLALSGLPMDRRSVLLWGRQIRGENVFSQP